MLGIETDRRAIALTEPCSDQNSFLLNTNVIASTLPSTATPRSPLPSRGASVVSPVSTCWGGLLKVPSYVVARLGKAARPASPIGAAAPASAGQLGLWTEPPALPPEPPLAGVSVVPPFPVVGSPPCAQPPPTHPP